MYSVCVNIKHVTQNFLQEMNIILLIDPFLLLELDMDSYFEHIHIWESIRKMLTIKIYEFRSNHFLAAHIWPKYYSVSGEKASHQFNECSS